MTLLAPDVATDPSARSRNRAGLAPVSVLIPTRNEVANLGRCLDSLEGWADEIVVVDSGSDDGTVELAKERGCQVALFQYEGGWPKKRQWALDRYPFRNPWTLLLDADEIVTPALKKELAERLDRDDVAGYYVPLDMVFLGRRIRHGGFRLFKLSLFRVGQGRYEKRLENQTKEMSDVEIHEHVVVDGPTAVLSESLEHYNVHSLHRYIHKHNEYSTWEAEVMLRAKRGPANPDEIPPRLWGGSQAQRRRWLKHQFFFMPGFSVAIFAYHYLFRAGFLDGWPGFVYCAFQAIQRFHTKVKVRELELQRGRKNP